MKKVVIGIVIGVAITLGIMYASRFIIPVTETPETTETHIYIDGKIVVRGDGEPIELINNPNATDPTYAELLVFLESDQVDRYSYIVGPPELAYVCTDFAGDVHNNAEAAGIRAAFVAVYIAGIDKGHALNAFRTTDMGLVYIDCTGKGLWDDSAGRTRLNRRAYVEEGQPYQVAFMEQAQTRFKFLVSQPWRAERQYILGDKHFNPFVTDEEILGRLEELGWIRFGSVHMADNKQNLEMLAWSRTHNTEELGLNWMEEWIREYQVELCGWDSEPYKFAGQTIHYNRDGSWTSSTSSTDYIHSHVLYAAWSITGDWLDVSWFQPVEELIDVDGIPVVWRIDWEMMPRAWYKPFGNEVVEAIYVHWGE